MCPRVGRDRSLGTDPSWAAQPLALLACLVKPDPEPLGRMLELRVVCGWGNGDSEAETCPGLGCARPKPQASL